MNTYLTIMVTVLVLTQVIRVTQNFIQLKNYGELNRRNDYLISVYEKLEKFLDKE